MVRAKLGCIVVAKVLCIFLLSVSLGLAQDVHNPKVIESARIVFADLDGDLDFDSVGADVVKEVCINQGDGFYSCNNFLFGTHKNEDGDSASPRAVAADDLDGDEDIDIVIAYEDLNSQLCINEETRFACSSFPGVGTASSIVLGDLDADEDTDAVVLSMNSETEDRICLNNGFASFDCSGFSFRAAFGSDVALGDMDSDNDLDIVMSHWNSPAEICINEDTRFKCSEFDDFMGRVMKVSLGDSNADGDLDVLLAGANSVRLCQNRDFFFSCEELIGSDLVSEMTFTSVFTDIDSDGDMDILVGRLLDHILCENGAHGMSCAPIDIDNSGIISTLHDIDADGDDDLVFGSVREGVCLNELDQGRGFVCK